MKQYRWRTRNNSARYVDSDTGDDLYGDGTMQKPFQSLGRAWRGELPRPSTIICRGYFSEDMADGDHNNNISIDADYYGAAVFDGANAYTISGFGHRRMIIRNVPLGNTGMNVISWPYWPLLAGVGRAGDAGLVGRADFVCGLRGGPALVAESALYFGCIGGDAGQVNKNAIWKPRYDETRKIWFARYNWGGEVPSMTVYDVPLESRGERVYGQGRADASFKRSIFAKVAFITTDVIRFNECLFPADTKWYHEGEELTIEGTTSAEREASLKAKLEAKGKATNFSFTNCRFSTQTSEEIFNDAEGCDLTLNPNGDGVDSPLTYYGAFPPALRIPIMDNSAGKTGTWDENSATGFIKVQDNAICYDDTSTSQNGEIMSKVVTIDPSKVSLSAIYAPIASMFSRHRVRLNCKAGIFGDTYNDGDTLPQGKYVSNGSLTYKGALYPKGAVFTVSEDDTSFNGDADSSASAIAILDPNAVDCVYVRYTPAVFAMIKAADGLQRGGVYLNLGNKSIAYRGRTIAAGESFVADNDDDTFSVDGDADYKVGVIFDDTRVPSQEWIPAQTMGEYFVSKSKGVIEHDAEGVPWSSGNPLSYHPISDGGYNDKLLKNVIDRRYVQFAIKAVKE